MTARFRPLVVLVMLVAAAAWIARVPRPGGGGSWGGAPTQPDAKQPEGLRPPVPLEAFGPSLSGGATGDLPFFGFCPEDGPAAGPQRRPGLGALLNIGQQEMFDRARAMRRDHSASEELRQGLASFFGGDGEEALETLAAAPDRLRDGFDFAATAAVTLAARRLHSGEPQDALRLADRALSLAPEQAAGHVLSALVHRRLGQQPEYRDALKRAHALEPDEPGIALALGRALAHTPNLHMAVTALDAYLQSSPQDVAIAQLRARLGTQHDIQRGLTETRRDGVRLLWPGDALSEELARTSLDAIVQGLDEAARFTGMTRRPELLAVIYREHSELLAVTCVPTWTQGVFDGTLRLHLASIQRPRERNRVVRHEVLHAQMRSGGFSAPQWFHEGLAQHFAHELGDGHHRTFRLMVNNRTYVPFPSLEGSFLVITQGNDARFAYHQSLAMIELLIDRHGDRAIQRGIEYLRGGGDATLLWDHVAGPRGLDGDDLLDFLKRRIARR